MFSRILIVVLLLYHLDVSSGLRKYYMEDECDGTINMESAAIPSGRLTVTRRSKYRNTLNCHVTIVAPLNRKIVIVFREMDIEWEVNCDDDFVSLHDGPTAASPVLQGTAPRICGQKIPPGNYVTKDNKLTVLFQSDVYKQNDGFELVFTAFHTAQSCNVDELRCNNGRCISSALRCNNFNNCGDNSDECEVNLEVAIALILSVFLLTVVGVGSILLYKKRERKFSTKKQQKLKSAIIQGAKIGIGMGAIEIHPCEACSLKIKKVETQRRREARNVEDTRHNNPAVLETDKEIAVIETETENKEKRRTHIMS